MSTDPFDAPATPIPRDGYGRPKVVPPSGGRPVGYTRCTTYVDCLQDTYNLTLWKQRMVALGISDRPDLSLAVSAHRDDKKKLNELAGQALEAAKASAAATTGTALHALTERIDRGQVIGAVPDAYRADLDAYRLATAPLEVVAIEQFGVLDELNIGGTFDRVVKYRDRYYIADVKTGGIDFGAMKIAMQLAVYSRTTPYHHTTDTRQPYPFTVDPNWAIVIHLPAGTGTCELRWIDIAAGWQAVQTATQVRAWRAHKEWFAPFEAEPNALELDTRSLERAVAEAATVDELRAVWADASLAGETSDALHTLCVARKTALEATP